MYHYICRNLVGTETCTGDKGQGVSGLAARLYAKPDFPTMTERHQPCRREPAA